MPRHRLQRLVRQDAGDADGTTVELVERSAMSLTLEMVSSLTEGAA